MNESEALSAFPAEISVRAADVNATLRAGEIVVVLDDDPTGTQSVADLPVLTAWEEADFEWAFAQATPAVYVLTNTRSLAPETAAERNREIVTNAWAASVRSGVRLAFASRSDSTLRGHFPLETDVIAETLHDVAGQTIDGVVIVPAFPDAGRITIGGVHYMRSGDSLTPIGDTEFARDATFGFASSALTAWVEEKTHGRIPSGDVIVLDLGIIRTDPGTIAEAISHASHGTPIVCDAVTENDLRLLSLGIAEAERRGTHLIYRVGPPFVRARIGHDEHAALQTDEIFSRSGAAESATRGGLIVVGSHVGLTTRQLARLRDRRPDVHAFEIDTSVVLDEAGPKDPWGHLVEKIVTALPSGQVVVSTSRILIKTDDPDESLEISRRISAAVVDIVRRVTETIRPRYVVAKGGITSSDVAVHGLGIRHAMVRGPMLPGLVSLWEAEDGWARGMPYIVFAGNVGDDESLADVVETLSPVAGSESTATAAAAATETPGRTQ
jgi:uncharacterized protein YgbK (DUF1537 family)